MKRTLRMLAGVMMVGCFSVAPTVQAQGPAYFVMPTPFAPAAITAPNGGASISVVHVIPLNGFTGTVSFTCAVTGGHAPLPTCMNPTPVKVTATYFVSVTAKSDKNVAPTFEPVAFPLDIRHEYIVH
jgi:hypothetical protein